MENQQSSSGIPTSSNVFLEVKINFSNNNDDELIELVSNHDILW